MLLGIPAASAAAAAPAVLGLLIAVNIAQNGGAGHPAPRLKTVDDVQGLGSKADFVAAWRAGSIPSGYGGEAFDGRLVPLGVLAAVSAFITHVLFAPLAARLHRRWRGKAFAAAGASGSNRFGREGRLRARGFRASVAPSRIDGRDALVLDYSDPECGDALWGRALFMRDELREVAPGVILGLGSMGATGGMWNCTPFVLTPARDR